MNRKMERIRNLAGFGMLEAVVAAAVLAILVLGISRTNVSALLSRQTLNERRIFNEKVSAATSALSIIDSCSCILGNAFPAAGNVVYSRFLREGVTGVGGNPTVNLNFIGYFTTPQYDATLANVGNGTTANLWGGMRQTCAGAPAQVAGDRDRVVVWQNSSVQNPVSNAANQGMVYIMNNAIAGNEGLQMRNVKYGGQVLDEKGNTTGCEIYVADVWMAAVRSTSPRQAGMSASIPVSFVIGSPTSNAFNAADRVFYKCYSKQDWENHYILQPKNSTGATVTCP